MVLGNVAPVLHVAPAGPSLDAVDRRTPDFLAPDDILEVECAAVIHNPLGDLAAGHGGHLINLFSVCLGHVSKMATYTTAVRAHKVDCLAAAVIRRPRAGAVSGAVDLPHPARERGNDLLRATHSDRLARTDGREGRRRVSAEARGARRAALHLGRPGALIRDGAAAAVALPAAVARAGVGA